jgi:NAD(P)H-flavin reductase/hemoglobin-like flavoprotein
MGLRAAMRRWLGIDGAAPPGSVETPRQRPRPASAPADPQSGGGTGSAPASTASAATPIYTPPPAQSPPAAAPPVGGHLVLGKTEMRLTPQVLPSFYGTPHAPTIGPPPRNYDRAAVEEVWRLLEPQAERLVRTFYAELFVLMPEAMYMFPSDMRKQRADFGRALVQWVVTDDPESMTAHLEQLGADHRKFDVEPKHYDVTGVALVNAMRSLVGSRWSPRYEEAILGSYTRLATVMIDGALRRAHEPNVWGATVVDHQRVSQDFAVLRIQPDAPYLYEPGQYTTVEIPRPPHAKAWRQMSIASAPRRDNTLNIHVRRVGAAGVSAALVAHTKAGDRLRLGPARGNDLVVKPGTVPGGLLCIASGTGAAPITAVVESILGWPEPPSLLYAYVGGRTQRDLYSVTHLNRLVHRGNNWQRMRIEGVLSEDPTFTGLRGTVEHVVPTLQPWARLGVDVLIAGPNPMISTTVTGLVSLGVPDNRIHFDQYESTG